MRVALEASRLALSSFLSLLQRLIVLSAAVYAYAAILFQYPTFLESLSYSLRVFNAFVFKLCMSKHSHFTHGPFFGVVGNTPCSQLYSHVAYVFPLTHRQFHGLIVAAVSS